MRTGLFYLLHSSAIAGLMAGSYFYGFKQASQNVKQKAFSFKKK
jgi:hypothetical protein